MFLTGFLELLDLAPKVMDREIIRLFETGDVKTSQGQRWGYLMCFGSTGLRLMRFVITNYTEYVGRCFCRHNALILLLSCYRLVS